VTIFQKKYKCEKKILFKPSTILANIGLATDRRCKFIKTTSEVFVVIASILLFRSEMTFYRVIGFESDSKIGDKSS